ncbi:uncharacterized protein LOC134278225 [Saccostrea cucullata]|uniref:uncharacterized protein LOC134278225 n=1 Tax=Saccostrea cuccullata TaxID=36930 RepID=UPI002ED54EB5
MSNRLEQVSTKLNKLDHIERRLNELKTDVNTELKEMKGKVNGVEECVTHISKQYDDQTREVKEMKKSVSNIRIENEMILNELEMVRNKFEDLNERHLDLQTRSMRDNLVFSGIPETEEENTEEVLKEFIRAEMNITEVPQFQGTPNGERLPDKHKPIVAKFVLHKEREIVRKAAPSSLEGKGFGVNEQFPREINERRKVVYPHYKKAKQQGKKAVMIADKLIIDSKRFFPPTGKFVADPGSNQVPM